MNMATVKVGDILRHRNGSMFTVESITFSPFTKRLKVTEPLVGLRNTIVAYDFVIWQDWEILDNMWRIQEPLNPMEVY